jgi:hypothetical protein
VGRIGTVAICALFCAPLPVPAQTDTSKIVGYVFDIQGSWRTARQLGTDLVVSQGLLQNDTVQLAVRRADAFIRIGLIDGTVAIRDCNVDPQNCQMPLQIVVPVYPTRLTIGDIWNHLTAPSKPATILTVSRGAGDGPLPEESILPLKRSLPDLAPALGPLPKGALNVFLTNASGEDIHLAVRWDPPRAFVSGPRVAPGIYGLRLSADRNSPGVAVLVAPAEAATRLTSAFMDAKRLMSGWPPEMGELARHNYLTSVLYELQRESSGGR